MKRIILTSIRYYQRAVSPGLPAACRFQPSCSRYAYEAIDRFGAARGSVMAARRLLRCMPWSSGGFDPVPEKNEKGLMQCEWVIEPGPAAPDEIRVDAGRLPV